MYWVTNGPQREEAQYMHRLASGHEGKRAITIGDPKPGFYSVDELIAQKIQGYYEVRPCQCDFCKELRRKQQHELQEDLKQ